MTRTDIHRPSAIDPAAYELATVVDLAETYDDVSSACNFPGGMMMAPPEVVERAKSAAALLKRLEADSPHDAVGRCGHCGARIKYAAIMVHSSGKHIQWGEQCLDTLGELASKAEADFRRVKIAAQARKTAKANAEARKAFQAEHPELYAFMSDAMANGADHLPFVCDVSRKFFHDPVRGLSQRQFEAMEKCRKGRERFQARKAEREAEQTVERVELPEDLLEQRIVITGAIVKLDAKEYQSHSYYGGTETRFVMTVKDDRGFVVWGTCPNQILHELDDEEPEGTKVQFACKVERPRNTGGSIDGFFTRPTKAKVLNAVMPTTHTCPSCQIEHDSKTEIYLAGARQVCTTCEPLAF